MKPLPANTIVKILLTNGFELSRQRGSHQIYRHPESGKTVIVAGHRGNQPIPIGTFLAIIKQSGLSRSDFEK
jgi:predicted RNA binding protein YcfA (HicA-like mRNA interferase family)